MSRERAISLRLRLALIFMACSLAILVATSGVQFWVFRYEISSRNESLLRDKMESVARMLFRFHGDQGVLNEEIAAEGASDLGAQTSLRILEGDTVLAESPGMAQRLPVASFPALEVDRSDSMGIFPPLAADRTGTRRFLVAQQRQGIFSVQGGLDVTEDHLMMVNYRHQLIYTLAGGAVICALFGWAAAQRGLQPLRDIADATQKITPNAPREHLELGRVPRELRDLVFALNAMLDHLNRAFERLAQFSSDLAHEFRTPITILMGEAEIVLAKDRSNEEYRQVLESSVEEYRRLSRLVSRMLFLARTEDPQAAVSVVPIDLGKLVPEVLGFFEAMAEEKGVQLECRAQGTVHGDSDMLRQALANLVSNALAATPHGGRIVVGGGRQGADWVLTVQDTGRGIPPEELPRVVDRFYRAGGDQARKNPGTGLGLAIVQSIAHLHGGTLAIESAPGQGTTVTLNFGP